MKILISAAEASSDVHGAKLLAALKELAPPTEKIEAFGIGGPRLAEAGLRCLVDSRELLVMGFTEILGRLPKIYKILDFIAQQAKMERPDIVVLMDYPDFHLRLAKKLKKMGIPVIYYIPPKLWVWRQGRARALKELFQRVLCIFPFEEDFYKGLGVSVKYVGNPLVDELPFELTREKARAELGLKTNDSVLTLLLGSRPAELKFHMNPMLEASVLTAKKLQRGRLQVLIPLPQTVEARSLKERTEALARNDVPVDFHIVSGKAHASLVAADVALVKSGTSTLEAGLLGSVHAVVYKPSWISNQIYKYFIRYQGPVALVNLVAGGFGKKNPDEWLIREILCENVRAETIAEEAYSLFTDQEKRNRIEKGLQGLREKIVGTQSPSHIAAGEILNLLK